jgi:hypothetical protein
MVQYNPIATANEQLVRQINQEGRRDPKSPYAGKFVGIANGQVVVVADSWREAAERLRQVESDPSKCRCIEASADYDRVEEIWRVAQKPRMRNSVPQRASAHDSTARASIGISRTATADGRRSRTNQTAALEAPTMINWNR